MSNANNKNIWRNIRAVFRRELQAYFATPVAYVFIVIFLFMTGVMTFYVGRFYESNQADLEAFFNFHPWLYLFLIPAIVVLNSLFHSQ